MLIALVDNLCHLLLLTIQSVCDRLCGRYDVDENQDVEVIVETVAVVDNSNYAECDLEGGKVASCQPLKCHARTISRCHLCQCS
jgi:hypothetical protein